MNVVSDIWTLIHAPYYFMLKEVQHMTPELIQAVLSGHVTTGEARKALATAQKFKDTLTAETNGHASSSSVPPTPSPPAPDQTEASQPPPRGSRPVVNLRFSYDQLAYLLGLPEGSRIVGLRQGGNQLEIMDLAVEHPDLKLIAPGEFVPTVPARYTQEAVPITRFAGF